KYHEKDRYQCVYQTQLKVKDLLNWTQLKQSNEQYQQKLDEVRQVLMKELGLEFGQFYEIPIYYWPPSITKRARSILPNMINNLYLEPALLVAKPFGPMVNGKDV